MIYQYRCSSCSHSFDVVKSVKEIDRPEPCQCGAVATREFVPSRVHFIGASVEHAEYNPGLGCIVKNSKHRAEIAKQKGLIEVGNDYKSAEAMHEKFDQDRAEKRERAYEEADRGWVGDGSV